MKIIFLIVLIMMMAFISVANGHECSNQEAKKFTATLLNHYRGQFDLPEVSQDELFTEKLIFWGRVLSKREITFETVGELEDYLTHSKYVIETDKVIATPLNASVGLGWALRASMAAKNGLRRPYKKWELLENIFICN